MIRTLRTLALAAAALVSGCAAPDAQVATPALTPATSTATTLAIPATDVPATAAPIITPSPTVVPTGSPDATEAAIPESCQATLPDQEGPFYVPGAPERSSVGQGHVLRGVVRSSDGCSPIAGAQIESWMAGPDGVYTDDYRATQFADAAGAYRFESNFPPPYTGRLPHIHLRVSAEGFETLITQYYPAEGQTEGAFDLVLIPIN
jgi:protocatechuate 3,4-dioxygenase beta subunit